MASLFVASSVELIKLVPVTLTQKWVNQLDQLDLKEVFCNFLHFQLLKGISQDIINELASSLYQLPLFKELRDALDVNQNRLLYYSLLKEVENQKLDTVNSHLIAFITRADIAIELTLRSAIAFQIVKALYGTYTDVIGES